MNNFFKWACSFPKLQSITFAVALASTPLAFCKTLPSLSHQTSWIGNTFGGADNKWVQDYIARISVASDGTVYTSSEWDEAGRCAGAYKDGNVEPALFRQYNGRGGHTAWGWGSAGTAVAVNKHYLFLSNTSGELLRFLRSNHEYVDTTKLVKFASLSATDTLLAAVDATGNISIYKADDLSAVGAFHSSGATDIALASDKTIWILADKIVKHVGLDGSPLSQTIDGLDKPTSISIDPTGHLIVCDNGPMQVLVFDVSGSKPRKIETFGDIGGIKGGQPGLMSPTKLFNLAGAGMDAAGNLYVAISGGMWDGTILRSFDTHRHPRWELMGRHFLDLTVADPASDGLDVYGNSEHYRLTEPGRVTPWAMQGYTIDPNNAADPRVKDDSLHPAFARRVGKNQQLLLFMTRQTPGPMEIFSFQPNTEFASVAAEYNQISKSSWGIYADRDGGIWEAGGQKISYTPLVGISADGKATYGSATSFDGPAPFSDIQRIEYISETDTMYLSGYTPTATEEAWGICGKVLARYDGWLKGNRSAKWVTVLPHDDKPKQGPVIIMKCMDVAGPYIFFTGVATDSRVWVYSAVDGKAVGIMDHGDEIGDAKTADTGWVDMPAGLSAFQRKNGEYFVFVEEDRKNKTILYRWHPVPLKE